MANINNIEKGQRYNIKIKNINDIFLFYIKANQIINDIGFDKSINGGVGDMSIEVIGNFGTMLNQQFFVEIYEKDVNTGSEFLIYKGIAIDINRVYGFNDTYQIRTLGLSYLLSKYIYNVGGSEEVEVNDDPAQIAKDLIDFVNSEFGVNLLSYGSNVVSTGTTINRVYKNASCLEIIQDLIDFSAGYYYYINANGELYFKSKPLTNDFIFSKGKDIIEVQNHNDRLNITNYLTLIWGEALENTDTYSDATSISTWKKSSTTIKNKNILDQTTANEFGNAFIEENKDPKNRTQALLFSQYNKNINTKNIDIIEPGTTCNLRNIDDEIPINLQIYKVIYSEDNILIEFEQFENVYDEIAKIATSSKKKISDNEEIGEILNYDTENDHFDNSEGIAAFVGTRQIGSIVELGVLNYNNTANYEVEIIEVDLEASDINTTSNVVQNNNQVTLDYTINTGDYVYTY